jgi:hypothetical protein
MHFWNLNNGNTRQSSSIFTLGRVLRVTFGMLLGIVTGFVWALTLPL